MIPVNADQTTAEDVGDPDVAMEQQALFMRGLARRSDQTDNEVSLVMIWWIMSSQTHLIDAPIGYDRLAKVEEVVHSFLGAGTHKAVEVEGGKGCILRPG